MTTSWRTEPERSNLATMRFIVWVALSFGRGAARSLLPLICIYFIAFAGNARRASRRYLGRVFGRPARWIEVYRHFHCFASTILDRVFLLNGREAQFDIEVSGGELATEIAASGQGCIFIGAHMGSFEILHMAGRVYGGLRTWMVMYEDNARRINAVLQAINPALNPPVIALGRIDSMLKIEQALGRGECVGMLADRVLHEGRTVDCGFLGATMPVPAGPFRVALMLDRPILLMFGLYRGGRRYAVHIERLAAPGRVARAERDAAVSALAHAYVARIEHHCRCAPYNWFNFHDVWR